MYISPEDTLTQLIVGSDLTSNTSCEILYWVTKTPSVLTTLQNELDNAIPSGVEVATYEMMKNSKCMNNIIRETLLIHSTASLGVPRVLPPGAGIEMLEMRFPSCTVLSVHSYTIHHTVEEMELPLIVGTAFSRYDFDLYQEH